ncbi:Rz1-like lysis system protein LysC [Vibrio mangrovi]|uniref:Uncharacterized protein n=1 Tax=Vibrio mangrovi TaxID=474394 RepID=A0A1Y6IWN2_9VIBR|nr:hypothetical protein [Vibrio mangrovi]MDW6005494.1 hypothetical protein [Vibrio mangrovi]SMS02064.1 hypothetical protein VIM7927_03378 [Vibrio mangrovi]
MSHTEPQPVIQVQYILPPEGMIIPCYKPSISGTWPEIVTEDIPRLKSALSQCAARADDYLQWRTSKATP